MKLHYKIGIFSLCYYMFNILTYFVYERAKNLETIENIKNDSEKMSNLNKVGVTIESIKESMLPDFNLFNPAVNLGWSIGSGWHYWLLSSVFSIFTLMILIKSKKQ